MNIVDSLFKNICELNLLELSELVLKIKSKFFTNDFIGVGLSNTVSNTNSKVDSNVSIYINKISCTKIFAIKSIKDIMTISLKDAKGIVDKIPCYLVKNILNSKASEYLNKLNALGVDVVIK